MAVVLFMTNMANLLYVSNYRPEVHEVPSASPQILTRLKSNCNSHRPLKEFLLMAEYRPSVFTLPASLVLFGIVIP